MLYFFAKNGIGENISDIGVVLEVKFEGKYLINLPNAQLYAVQLEKLMIERCRKKF